MLKCSLSCVLFSSERVTDENLLTTKISRSTYLCMRVFCFYYVFMCSTCMCIYVGHSHACSLVAILGLCARGVGILVLYSSLMLKLYTTSEDGAILLLKVWFQSVFSLRMHTHSLSVLVVMLFACMQCICVRAFNHQGQGRRGAGVSMQWSLM